jgi:outer membrane protein assembly factor BamB
MKPCCQLLNAGIVIKEEFMKFLVGLVIGCFAAQTAFAQTAPGTLLWEIQVGVLGATTPAIDYSGRLIVGAAGHYDSERQVFTGTLSAINPNGELQWSLALPDQITSSPSIARDGSIYVGSRDSKLSAGKLYAFDENGVKKWEFPTTRPIVSVAAIGKSGNIYVAASDKVYGLTPEGTKLWHYPTTNGFANAWQSSPALGADETIYIGSYDGQLHAINPNGTPKWAVGSRRGGAAVRTAPAVGADGTIYFCSDDGSITAINPDGTQKWMFPTRVRIYASPIIGPDQIIYFGSTDTRFYALRPDGTNIWQTTLDGGISTTAAIAQDGTIYVATGKGFLYRVGSDGMILGQDPLAVGISSPVIGQTGIVFVGMSDGRLLALQGYSPLARSSWPMLHNNPQHTSQQTAMNARLIEPTFAHNVFSFMLESIQPGTFAVESSSDLKNWTVLTNVTSQSIPIQVTDPTSVDTGFRFYRIRPQ